MLLSFFNTFDNETITSFLSVAPFYNSNALEIKFNKFNFCPENVIVKKQ